MWSLASLLLVGAPDRDLTADDAVVTESCNVTVSAPWIADANGDGVVHVTGSDLVVDFAGATLRGGPPGTAPEDLAGIGVVVTGQRVTIRGARLAGFRTAILALGADGLVLEDCEVLDAYRPRLASTPELEEASDWLRPHENDANEWLLRYGAAVWVEETREPTLRRLRVRNSQNGIVLDEVTGARVHDCDASFLSGWGLALWRSSGNVIARNAFDFCVRGYSHGVYNRGQDSAGILLFEQCNENVIAENSATHCGDGLFAFAGREALGEVPPPGEDFDYVGRGNRGNLIFGNDFSFAAAHGLELTFSSDNAVIGNTFRGNAICGIWGGYSRGTLIQGNVFEQNGFDGYGSEHGGVNIEHGTRNAIVENVFRGNSCGVHLWWDADPGLAELPWSRANGIQCRDNTLVGNSFEGDEVGLQLESCTVTTVSGNRFTEVAEPLRVDGAAPEVSDEARAPEPPELPAVPGETRPVGARGHLAGRENIYMGPYGPHDGVTPLLRRRSSRGATHVYELLGEAALQAAEVDAGLELEIDRKARPPRVVLRGGATGDLVPYRLRVQAGGEQLTGEGVLLSAPWVVWSFAWTRDPRTDPDGWRAEGEAAHVTSTLPALDLPYGSGGPSDLALAPADLIAAGLPGDRFGTIASTKVRIPAGRWLLRTLSDDGVRLWADGELLIDEWNQHAPTVHEAELVLDDRESVDLRIEHFELDGWATLRLEILRAR